MLNFMAPLSIFTTSILGIMVISDRTYFDDPMMRQVNTDSTIHDHSKHAHGTREVSELTNLPALSMSVTEDTFSNGWNIQLNTENFSFSPEHVNSRNINNEGHAHIYIDNKKVARVYSHWNYVFDLEPGTHVIRATLNSNDHDRLTIHSVPVEASVTIIQKNREK